MHDAPLNATFAKVERFGMFSLVSAAVHFTYSVLHSLPKTQTNVATASERNTETGPAPGRAQRTALGTCKTHFLEQRKPRILRGINMWEKPSQLKFLSLGNITSYGNRKQGPFLNGFTDIEPGRNRLA